MISREKSFFKNHPLFFLSIVYLTFRLINLTKLPVFNDEAIYLDWAWRETHQPGELFYSLYDAKQPLLMWLFGISQIIFPDPFFAGRSVSVLFGFLAMAGIYKIGKAYFSHRIGIVAALLYVVVPIFSFYDRQALMEAAIGAIGIWTLWFALKFWKNGLTKDAIFVGILLGIGFFIKSSALLFLVTFFIISLRYYRNENTLKFRALFFVIVSFFSSIILLLLQPKFWETFSTNTRYSFGLIELLHFPVATWLANIAVNAEIGFFFLTPVVFIVSFVGMFLLLKKGKKEQKKIALWFLVALFLQILVVRGTSQRYLVSYLPPMLLFAVYATEQIATRYKSHFSSILLWSCLFIFPLLVTFIQITNPLSYFRFFHFSRVSEEGVYVLGQTSGYGIPEAVMYIETLHKGKKIFLGESLYSGNPESAIIVAFAKSKFITVGYLDQRLLGNAIDNIDCLQVDVPVYFVSKKNDVAGLEKFLTNISYLKNPYNKNVIGIWKLRENCEGTSLPLQLVKTK